MVILIIPNVLCNFLWGGVIKISWIVLLPCPGKRKTEPKYAEPASGLRLAPERGPTDYWSVLLSPGEEVSLN